MYCALDDIRARLEEPTLTALCDDDGDGVADPGVVEAAIADADAEIDTNLATRYAVPISSPPAVLRAVAAWLSIAALFRRRRETPSPLHAEQAEHARRILSLLARGRMSLPGIPAAGGPDSNRSADDKAFRTESLSNL